MDDTPEDPRYPEALHRDLYLQGSKRWTPADDVLLQMSIFDASGSLNESERPAALCTKHMCNQEGV